MSEGRELVIDTPDWALPLLEPKRYKGAFGGRGSGKSHFFAESLVEECIADPNLCAVCIREIQKSLEFSAKRLIENKIDKLGVGHLFDVQDSKIVRVGGKGVILFQGMQDHTAESIKSLEEFHIAWCEEAQSLSARSMELLLPTIRSEGGEVWFSWNPDQPTDPVDRLLRGPRRDPDSIAVDTDLWRNPFRTRTLIKEAESHRVRDPETFDHVWLGEYRVINNAQVLNGKWRVDSFEPLRMGPGQWDGPYYGADWGFAQDPTALVRMWIAPGSEPDLYRLMIEHEAVEVGTDLDDLPELFERVPGAREHVIRADNARPETISHMKQRGFSVVAAPKWKGSVEDGIAWLRSFEEIVIHTRCTTAAREARLWSYKVDRWTEDVLPRLVPGNDHIFDGIRYSAAPMIMNMGSSRQGLMVRRDWWRQWKASEPPVCDLIWQFVVPALEDKDGNNTSARTTWGVFTRRERWDNEAEMFVRSDDPDDTTHHCILLERWVGREGFPELREQIKQGVKDYDPDWVFVEERASGKALLQELRRARLPARAVRKSSDYTFDLQTASVVPQKGHVWYMDRPWSQEVIASTADYPQTPDPGLSHSCALAWSWIRQRNEVKFAGEEDDIEHRKPKRASPYG